MQVEDGKLLSHLEPPKDYSYTIAIPRRPSLHCFSTKVLTTQQSQQIQQKGKGKGVRGISLT